MTDLQKNRLHKEVIRLVDGEGAGVTGEAANIEVMSVLDGVVTSTIAFTVTEIETTDPDVEGSYEISWTPSTGSYLYVRAWHDTYEIIGWDENYRILEHLQDQSGFGDRTVVITVRDGDSDVVIPDVRVSIYDAGLTYRYATGSTNTSGQVTLSVSDGTYAVVMSKIGYYEFSQESLVVSADATATYYGTAFSPSTPSTPGLCVVYGWEYDPAGDPVAVTIVAEVMADNRFLTTNPHIIRRKQTTSAAADGYWELALTRSDQYAGSDTVTYNFKIDGKKQGDFSVPARASIAFRELIGL